MNIERHVAQDRKRFHFDNVFIGCPVKYKYINLQQIGDLGCDSGYSVQPHRQCCYEIIYIVSGEGCFFYNGASYPVSEGDIFICKPGDVHDLIADINNPLRCSYLGFDFLSDLNGYPFSHVKCMFDSLDQPCAKDGNDIKSVFIKTFEEIINQKEYSAIMMEFYLYEIIITAYKNFLKDRDTEYDYKKNTDNYEQIVYRIINYIDNNFFDIDCVMDISKHIRYDYSYLSHVFTSATGISIRNYYNRIKFQKAREMIGSADYSVTEVAHKLQYQSIHSFSNAFKKYTGMSPTEYYKANKK